MTKRYESESAYLLAKSVQEGECHIWTGSTRRGYGAAVIYGRHHHAHRLAWQLANGPIPDGLFVCHTCDNRRCIRIEHLFLGTASENALDMAGKQRANRKLTSDQVRQIADDKRKGVEVAREYGVSESMVSMIRRGRTRHVALGLRGTGATE